MSANSFEIFLVQGESHGPSENTVRLFLETTPETDECIDSLVKPFGRESFELMWGLNNSFQQSNFWPWAIILLDREYRLAGHVCASRNSLEDVLFTAYSVRHGYSITATGPPPVSMLFFRSKGVASALASQSPLFSACWSMLADKPQNRNWLCILDTLAGSWVGEMEKEDDALFARTNAIEVC